MASTIQPIETRYAGYRFRSRLEARWAVFFDTLGVCWEYEPEGFNIDGRLYLPDFLLPDCGTWVEVKGDENRLDKPFLRKAASLLPKKWNHRGERGPALMVLGAHPKPHPQGGDWGWLSFDDNDADGHGCQWGFGDYRKNCRPRWFDDDGYCGDEQAVAIFDMLRARGVRIRVFEGRLQTSGPAGAIGPALAARLRLSRELIIASIEARAAWLTPSWHPLERSAEFAYNAARSARFEHGENG